MQASAEALEQKFIGVEEHLQNLWLTGRGQDGVRYPARLGGQLVYLARGIASSDFGPTNQQQEVHALFEQQIRTHQSALDQLMRRDLPAFNALLQERGIGSVVGTGG